MENKFKKWRKRKGFTQQDIAEKLGIRYQNVQRWEYFGSSPKPVYWPQLAKILDITVDDLYDFSADVEAHKKYKAGGGVQISIENSTIGQQAAGDIENNGKDSAVNISTGVKLTPKEQQYIELNRRWGNDTMLAKDVETRLAIKEAVEKIQKE